MIALMIRGLLFSALLICAAVTDIKRRVVYNWLCVAILIVSLIGNSGSFWGAVITALPFFIPSLIKNGSIGGGDIKLMFVCGAVLGVWGGLSQALIALSLVFLFALGILIAKGFKICKKNSNTPGTIPMCGRHHGLRCDNYELRIKNEKLSVSNFLLLFNFNLRSKFSIILNS
jgi:leader peptidase (prepilin peptidase)/N-methyltransferase